MPSLIEIRPATMDDIPSILDIEAPSFPTGYSEATYIGELDRDIALFYVAEFEGRVVGFSLSWALSNELHVLKIASAPSFRQRGAATRLMEESIDEAKRRFTGDITAFLEVRTSNLAAQKFYKRLGFGVLGIRKRYYTDTDEDALVLGRIIKAEQADPSV